VFKQFPVLNLIIPEAHAQPVCFITLKCYYFTKSEGNIIMGIVEDNIKDLKDREAKKWSKNSTKKEN